MSSMIHSAEEMTKMSRDEVLEAARVEAHLLSEQARGVAAEAVHEAVAIVDIDVAATCSLPIFTFISPDSRQYVEPSEA